jgi:hypothetical protein
VGWGGGNGGERGKGQRVGQLLPGRAPEGMAIRHHEQDTGPPSKLGFFLFLQGVQLMIACRLYRYWLIVHCVNVNKIFVCRLKKKTCKECIIIMHLISWNHSRGSEIITMNKTQVSPLPDKIFINFYQQSNLVIC